MKWDLPDPKEPWRYAPLLAFPSTAEVISPSALSKQPTS